MTNRKKIKIIFKSAKKTLRITADFLYAVMFIVLTVYGFLNTTQFDMSWVKLLEFAEGWNHILYVAFFSPQVILIPVIIMQYLCSDNYDWKEYVLATVICCLVCYAFKQNKESDLLGYILLIIGARNFSFRRLMYVYFVVIFGLVVWTIAGSQMGWLENLIYAGDAGAFGFIYTTDCAAHILFLTLCYWCIRRENIHYIELAIFFAIGVFVWVGCKARFSTVLLFLLTCFAYSYKVLKKKMGKDNWNHFMSGIPSAILAMIPLLCSLGIHLLSIIYSDKSGWMKVLNSVVSSRLSITKRAVDVYGFSLYGSHIPMIGNGGGTEREINYFYIDSAFMQISLLYGLLALGIILLLFLLVCMKARKDGNWVLLAILAVVSLHGIFEHHAFELSYSPFLFAVFAELRPSGISIRKRDKLEAGKEQI